MVSYMKGYFIFVKTNSKLTGSGLQESCEITALCTIQNEADLCISSASGYGSIELA